MTAALTLPWDWYPGSIPGNALIHDDAYVETSFSFTRYRSHRPVGLEMGPGAAAYLGTMFDVGPNGRVRLGEYTMSHGAWFICDDEITVGNYTMISWNVVFMDSYRASFAAAERRCELERVAHAEERFLLQGATARPIHVGSNAWIGFDVCIMPGVRIGDGAVVGARSIVFDDVPPYSIAAGNPARVIRRFDAQEELPHG